MQFDTKEIRIHAEQFDKKIFKENLDKFIQDKFKK
jgi:hypothetical protein